MPYISLKMCAGCCRLCSQSEDKNKKDEFKEEMRHYLDSAGHSNGDMRYSPVGSEEDYYLVVQSILACADLCLACDEKKSLIHDYLDKHILRAYESGVQLVMKSIKKEEKEFERRCKKGKSDKVIDFKAERERRSGEEGVS